MGETRNEIPASEKLEIIGGRAIHPPVRRTLEKLGIQPARFYRWYDRLQTGGLEAWKIRHQGDARLESRPDAIRDVSFNWPWTQPELSPRERPRASLTRQTTSCHRLRLSAAQGA